MGAIEGDQIVSDNEWETIASRGETAIANWINDQMRYKAAAVVMIGANTASRKWVKYEIERAWNLNKGVVGIHIHNLKDRNGMQSNKGQNPFSTFTVDGNYNMSSIVHAHDSPYSSSADTYNYIRDNIESWIDQAISIRSRYAGS